MRTNEERSALIHRRIRELKRQQARKKERLVMWIPDSRAHSEGTMAHSAMTASLIGGSAFSGYIVMGILSFLLGVCVTILLYRLHRHFRDRKEEQDEF